MERTKWHFDLRSSLITLVLIGLCGLGYRVWEERLPVPSTVARVHAIDPEQLARLKVGMDGTVRNPLRGAINVGRTRETYERMRNAEDSNDQVTLRGIIASGHGYKVTNGNGAALMDKDPLGSIQLQFTGGDHAGEVGWTGGEYFNPSGVAAQPIPGAPSASSSTGTPPVGGP